MKKVFSLLLVACMLMTAMAISASAAIETLDPIVNTNTYIPTPVEVLKVTKAPDIDGVITKEEWVGKADIKFGPATAGTTIYSANPERAEYVSADNTFWDPYYTTLTEEQYNKMNTQVWFRYDDKNMYIAARVYDVTGCVNKCADEMSEIWNGDAIEFTIDPEGPNSGMLPRTDANDKVPGFDGIPGYDWTTTPFNQEIFNYYRTTDEMNINNNYRKCWIKDLQKKNDFVLARGYWDDEVYAYETCKGSEYYNNAAITVEDNGDGTCYINYEIKIKWGDILRTYGKVNKDIYAGKVFGAVFSVTEAWDMDLVGDWRYYDSCYSWGSGHFGGQAQDGPNTSGGTNAIVLSATEVTPYETPFVDDEPEGDVGGGNEGGDVGGNEGSDEPVVVPPVIEEGGDDIEIDKDDVVVEPSTDATTGTEVQTVKFPVVSKPDYKTATELSYTLAFDTEKFEFDSIVGLDEADYKLEKNDDGSYKLTIINVEKVKAATTGAKLFEVAVKTKEGVKIDDVADVKLEIKDTYKKVTKPATTVTPNKKPSSPATGDEFVVVAAVAVVALAGFAVATKKRRFN